MTDVLPIAIPALAGLLALLFAPSVDRWVERFERWVDERLFRKGHRAEEASHDD